MSTIRMLCPPSGNTIHKVNGRTYTGVLGTPQDVLEVDADQLQANGWTPFAGGGYSGTTAQRPTSGLTKGVEYADTTLGYSVVYDGASWRNMAGASV
jgi:hypothetical protein